MTDHITPKLNQCTEFSDQLQETVPTNNISRESLAELIGSIIEYQTGASYTYDDLTLETEGHSAGKYTVGDIVRTLNVKEWNAVRSVTNKDEKNDDHVTIKFH
jgi:hypothetical protein